MKRKEREKNKTLAKGKQRKGAIGVKSKKKKKTKQGKKKIKKEKDQKKDQSKKFPLFFNFYQKAIFFQKIFTDKKLLLLFSIFVFSSVEFFLKSFPKTKKQKQKKKEKKKKKKTKIQTR
jgi:hypothetical protein